MSHFREFAFTLAGAVIVSGFIDEETAVGALHAGASDAVAVLIDDPTGYRAVAFSFGLRPAR